MMVKIRHLLNPLILSSGMVGFFGDSEYRNSDGELVMGYWNFIKCSDCWVKDEGYLSLDDCISDVELFEGDGMYEVFNDKGNLCLVQFIYRK